MHIDNLVKDKLDDVTWQLLVSIESFLATHTLLALRDGHWSLWDGLRLVFVELFGDLVKDRDEVGQLI